MRAEPSLKATQSCRGPSETLARLHVPTNKGSARTYSRQLQPRSSRAVPAPAGPIQRYAASQDVFLKPGASAASQLSCCRQAIFERTVAQVSPLRVADVSLCSLRLVVQAHVGSSVTRADGPCCR
ncbi:uncharacterized protein O9250_007580 [Rhynochetos jubatus]